MTRHWWDSPGETDCMPLIATWDQLNKTFTSVTYKGSHCLSLKRIATLENCTYKSFNKLTPRVSCPDTNVLFSYSWRMCHANSIVLSFISQLMSYIGGRPPSLWRNFHSPLIMNNYSSSLNGLWVNNPWGRRPNGLLTQSHESERNNCFSKIQLVGQKYRE